jgi:hypothetical protein
LSAFYFWLWPKRCFLVTKVTKCVNVRTRNFGTLVIYIGSGAYIFPSTLG